MKSKIFILLACVISLASCNEDILDIKNPAGYNEETFFKTQEEINKGIMATYGVLLHNGMYARDWYFIFDFMGSDAMKNTFAQGGEAELYNMTFSNTASHIANLWLANYRMRTRACIMVEKAGAFVGANDSEKKFAEYVKGEALFLKSLAYFNLIRMFGAVPFADTWTDIKNPEKLKLPRTPESEIYPFIEKDLAEAISLLPEKWSDSELGRATKYSAMALLAKVLVTEGKFDDALTHLKAIETSGKYKLWEGTSGFSKNFLIDNWNSPESLFDVRHNWWGWGMGNAYYMFGGQETWGGKASHTGRAMEYGFNDWWNAFFSSGSAQAFTYTLNGNAGYKDPRGPLSFYGDPNENGDGDWKGGAFDFRSKNTCWKKYNRYEAQEKENEPSSPINSQIIRYADVLLLMAECYIFKPSPDFALAKKYINDVRARVGATPYSETPSDINTAFDILKRERRLEFAGEQQRWFDLKRWELLGKVPGFKMKTELDIDRAADVLNKPTPMPEKYFWLPIPKVEMDNNPAMKNDLHFSNWN